MKKFLLITTILFAAIATVFVLLYRGRLNEVQRLNRNQTALMTDMTLYRNRLGESVASVETLSLTVDELKRLRANDAALLRSLNIRLRRAEQIAQTATSTVVEVQTVVRDTVFVRDTLRQFAWSDGWVDVSGTIAGNSMECRVESRDTLTQIIHRVPRRFLFFRWGTRSVRSHVVSHNPHTTIVSTSLVEIVD